MLKKLPISLTVVFLVLGILLSTQFQSQRIAIKSLAEQKPEDLATMMTNLTEKRLELLHERMELNSQLKIFTDGATKEDELAESMEKEINRLKAINGKYALKGPGMRLTIFNPPQSQFLSHDDLVAIVNEFWHAKAEAIAVNGTRITNTTTIAEDPYDLSILVNGEKVSFPLRIEAIGNTTEMEKKVIMSGGYLSILRTLRQINMNFEQVEELHLPEVKGIPAEFTYAKPVTET